MRRSIHVILVGMLSVSVLARRRADTTNAVTKKNSSGDEFPRTLPLAVRHVNRPPFSRILPNNTLDGHDIPANGAVFPTAIYYTNIQIGTPPKDFAVGIDSGSGDLFVEGKDCDGCTKSSLNRQYDPTKSSSSNSQGRFRHSYKTCNFLNPSASCTISGQQYTEQVSLAGLGPVTVKVGAIQSQTTNFDTKRIVGGLMGLGGFDGEDPLSTLANAGLCKHVWGMCFKSGSVSNGTLTIGGADATLADGPITYVPDQGLVLPTVDVSSLTLGNTAIPLKWDTSAVLDTGTNVLLLGRTAFSKVQSAMCADSSLTNCAELWENECVELTDEQVEQYPPLSFQLDGTVLEMSSRDYLLLRSPLATKADQYCLGIRNGGSTGFIIGDTTMRNYYVVFDKAQRRIGWGKVNKETCGSK